tara:strand:- start:354 stop:1523 length:1170 start_codon:yes stop_codon:yes gene_type:complete
MMKFAQVEHQIPFLGESSIDNGILPHNSSAECIYQLILWWFNYESHPCTGGGKGKIGSKLAQLLALLAVGIIPLTCIDRDPPELAKKAMKLMMNRIAQEITEDSRVSPGRLPKEMTNAATRYLNESTFENSQDLFYTYVAVLNKVEVYSSDSATTAMLDVSSWTGSDKKAAYNALVCFLSIIRPPLAWCQNVDCSNPSDATLMKWMQGSCIDTNISASEMRDKLKKWKKDYNMLGSNWHLASQLLISESEPDDILISESLCVIADAKAVAEKKLYHECEGVKTIENYITPSPDSGITRMLQSIDNAQSNMLPNPSLQQNTNEKPAKPTVSDDSGRQADAQVTVSTTPSESKSFNWPLFGAVTGVVVLAIILIIGFVFLKKKADQGEKHN